MTKKDCIRKLKKLIKDEEEWIIKYDGMTSEGHLNYTLDLIATFKCAINFMQKGRKDKDLTTAYMVGYEKGKDETKALFKDKEKWFKQYPDLSNPV